MKIEALRLSALVVGALTTFVTANCLAAFGVEGTTARMDGRISVKEVQEFLQSERIGEVRTLEIRSNGGDVIAAMHLARWVKANSIDVEVIEVCASSCANYVFPAGKNKKIRDGAILIWHGGAFQRSLENFGERYEQALLRVKLNEGTPSDRSEVNDGAERYTMLRLNQSLEREFFRSINVDGRLPTIGQEVMGYSLLWTLSLEQMESLGLRNVVVPAGYASEAYIRDWQAAHSKAEGDARKSIRLISLPEQVSSCERAVAGH